MPYSPHILSLRLKSRLHEDAINLAKPYRAWTNSSLNNNNSPIPIITFLKKILETPRLVFGKVISHKMLDLKN